jgi:hypothetical protein
VGAVVVVIGDVVADRAQQLPLSQDHEVIKQFASKGPDEALGVAVLPG